MMTDIDTKELLGEIAERIKTEFIALGKQWPESQPLQEIKEGWLSALSKRKSSMDQSPNKKIRAEPVAVEVSDYEQFETLVNLAEKYFVSQPMLLPSDWAIFIVRQPLFLPVANFIMTSAWTYGLTIASLLDAWAKNDSMRWFFLASRSGATAIWAELPGNVAQALYGEREPDQYQLISHTAFEQQASGVDGACSLRSPEDVRGGLCRLLHLFFSKNFTELVEGVYISGGAARDLLLGNDVKDLDVFVQMKKENEPFFRKSVHLTEGTLGQFVKNRNGHVMEMFNRGVVSSLLRAMHRNVIFTFSKRPGGVITAHSPRTSVTLQLVLAGADDCRPGSFDMDCCQARIKHGLTYPKRHAEIEGTLLFWRSLFHKKVSTVGLRPYEHTVRSSRVERMKAKGFEIDSFVTTKADTSKSTTPKPPDPDRKAFLTDAEFTAHVKDRRADLLVHSVAGVENFLKKGHFSEANFETAPVNIFHLYDGISDELNEEL